MKKEYIASFSGGKDSVATIILAKEKNEPLNTIIFSEVMFDENISGELPEHINFCKLKPIKEYLKRKEHEITQYIGIAIDEPKRLERLDGINKISLLAKYGYTEQMAMELCKKYNLLSPLYGFSRRGGCWFCPNAKNAELKHLRKEHKELWQKLLELENEKELAGTIWNTLTKTSLAEKEAYFLAEEKQITIFDL